MIKQYSGPVGADGLDVADQSAFSDDGHSFFDALSFADVNDQDRKQVVGLGPDHPALDFCRL